MQKLDPMYCDSGKFMSQIKRKNTKEYAIWNGIRGRCYRDYGNRDFSYKGCTVSKEFYSFQNFSEWANQQIGFTSGFQLDKDLLVKGNKIYSPDTCVFLPRELNSILIKNSSRRGNLPIGVTLDKRSKIGLYQACVRESRIQKHLGSFKTPEEAFFAYKVGKEKLLRLAAIKFKDVIDIRAFNALMSYKVEITD